MTHIDKPADEGPQRDEQVLDSLHGWSRSEPDGPAEGQPDSSIGALQRENEQLREAIDSRAVIEQAKGALILRYGLDDDAAFAVLRRWSQGSNTKLHTIADVLVNTVCRDDPQPSQESELADWLRQQVLGLPRHGDAHRDDPAS
jgi:hypothetical protein